MIAWTIAALALGTAEAAAIEFVDEQRCAPVFTLMSAEGYPPSLLRRRAPQRQAGPVPARPRSDGRPRLRPCLHLANS
jgi:hypothetical protein